MGKPEFIQMLEAELQCEFKEVSLSQIEGYTMDGTTEFAIDDNGNLTGLCISNKKLNKIPGLFHLRKEFVKNLTSLNLSDNQLTDISSLAGLTSLTELWLVSNQLTDISSVKRLEKLRLLNLQKNPIAVLPEWICDFQGMEIRWKEDNWENGFITFFDNPLISPEVEIVRQGKKAIKEWFVQYKKGKPRYNFEVKLMLIGEGGTGKTSLLRKLMDKNASLPAEADTTPGVDIRKWEFGFNKKLFEHLLDLEQENLLVNIWDFGGQKIYHGTHQIFFGENNFYILVEETREHKTDFSYWLNTLEQLAGDKTNLQIVINQKFGHIFKFDYDGYKSRFGFIQPVTEIDLSRNDEVIIKLQEAIRYQLQNLHNVGLTVPASYSRVSARVALRKAAQTQGVEAVAFRWRAVGSCCILGVYTHISVASTPASHL